MSCKMPAGQGIGSEWNYGVLAPASGGPEAVPSGYSLSVTSVLLDVRPMQQGRYQAEWELPAFGLLLGHLQCDVLLVKASFDVLQYHVLPARSSFRSSIEDICKFHACDRLHRRQEGTSCSACWIRVKALGAFNDLRKCLWVM